MKTHLMCSNAVLVVSKRTPPNAIFESILTEIARKSENKRLLSFTKALEYGEGISPLSARNRISVRYTTAFLADTGT